MDTTPIAWAVLVARLPAVAALPFEDAADLAAASLEDLGHRTADALERAMSAAERTLSRLGAVQGRLTDSAGHTASALAGTRHHGTAAAAYRTSAGEVLAELAHDPRAYLAEHRDARPEQRGGAPIFWKEQETGPAEVSCSAAHLAGAASLAAARARKALEEARLLLGAAERQRALAAEPEPGWKADDHRLWAELLHGQAKDALGTARAHLGAAQRFTDQGRHLDQPDER